MFTVCPKCALTLVVTAADLRVAQGYVRCGRCSNVFNALARLSEDRNMGAPGAAPPPPSATSSPAATPAPPAKAAPTPPRESAAQNPTVTQPWEPASQAPPKAAQPREPAAQQPQPKVAQAPEPAPEPPSKVAPPQPMASTQPSASVASGAKPEAQPQPEPAPAPAARAKSPAPVYFDDSIPDSALEFNAEATDVSEVFVEPPRNSGWEEATGTFKSLVQKSSDTAATESEKSEPPWTSAERAAVEPSASAPVRIELDPDFVYENNTSRFIGRAGEQGQQLPAELPGAPASGASPGTQPPLQQTPTEIAAALRVNLADTRTLPKLDENAAAEPPQSAASEGVGLPQQMETAAPDAEAPKSETELSPPPRARLRSTMLWGSGAGALAVLLVAQVLNHYRNDLAASPRFGKPVTALYAALGVKLTPHWDLRAYDVRQLGASVDSDHIMVRASVKNGARQAQPMPFLRVTLQDRFGNRIAARDVAPRNYLPRAAAYPFLSAGQRIDAEMAIVDPGSNAVGFEIDACLPAPSGGITCANDVAPANDNATR